MPPGGTASGPTPEVALCPAHVETLASLTAHVPTEQASRRTGQGRLVARKGKRTTNLRGVKAMIAGLHRADRAGVKVRREARTHASVLTNAVLTAAASAAMDGAAEDARNSANRCFTRRQPCPAH